MAALPLVGDRLLPVFKSAIESSQSVSMSRPVRWKAGRGAIQAASVCTFDPSWAEYKSGRMDDRPRITTAASREMAILSIS